MGRESKRKRELESLRSRGGEHAYVRDSPLLLGAEKFRMRGNHALVHTVTGLFPSLS